jgi:Sugar (and other) transporter
VLYYAPTIMEQTGLSASNSIIYAVIIGVVNLAMTIVFLRLIDRIGRRPLLLISLIGMAVSVTVLGLARSWPTPARAGVHSDLRFVLRRGDGAGVLSDPRGDLSAAREAGARFERRLGGERALELRCVHGFLTAGRGDRNRSGLLDLRGRVPARLGVRIPRRA